MSNKAQVRTGGYDNYSIRGSTLIMDYFPGPGRSNLLLDPDSAIGKFDPGTFGGDDAIMNGPGTLLQALPDASRFQYDRIFAVPTGNPYREFGVDDRQIASYQVEQLRNNPLSQYTINPNAPIPKFECMAEPDNFSAMVNKREESFKNYFEGDPVKNWLEGLSGGINVYPLYSSSTVNSNSEVVYNMNLDTAQTVNPMISLGSSSIARTEPNFGGLCYSGQFTPGEQIDNSGGINPPYIYRGTYSSPRTQADTGFMNPNPGNNICTYDRSLSFSNPLILQNRNIA